MPRQLPEGREKWAVSRTEYERRLKGDVNWQRFTKLVAETFNYEYGANRPDEEQLRLMLQQFGSAAIAAVEQRAADPWVALRREFGIGD